VATNENIDKNNLISIYISLQINFLVAPYCLNLFACCLNLMLMNFSMSMCFHFLRFVYLKQVFYL